MGIGIRLRTLWRLRLGVVLSLAVALLAAVWSVRDISLSPPSLTPRSLQIATASSHVVVDTPKSTLLDLRQDTYSLDGLKSRAVLLGNVIASAAVRQSIAAKVGVPVEALRIQPPLTQDQPAPPVDSENARHTGDILKTSSEYRLDIQANPTVPMLDVYAQTPDAASAAGLVNAAVDELRAYIGHLAAADRTPAESQIRLVQLGRANGVVVNPGVDWKVAVLVFVLVFAICSATVVFVARVRAGWRLAALADSGSSG